MIRNFYLKSFFILIVLFLPGLAAAQNPVSWSLESDARGKALNRGHDYLRLGVLPLHPAQIAACRPLSLGCHCTGIQHHDGCIRCRDGPSSGARKLRRQRIAVRRACPAAEVFYVISFHVPQSSWSCGGSLRKASTGPLLVW